MAIPSFDAAQLNRANQFQPAPVQAAPAPEPSNMGQEGASATPAEGQQAYQNDTVMLSPESQIPVQPGTLYISDLFTPRPDGAEQHGELVAKAAREQGFDGPIVANNIDTASSSEATQYRRNLYSKGLTPEQTIDNLRKYVSTSNAEIIERDNKELDRLVQAGAKSSVLNFSHGGSKARAVAALTNMLEEVWGPKMPSDAPGSREEEWHKGNAIMLENLASAAGLDVAKIKSAEPKVAEKEKGKLIQFLIDQVSDAMDTEPAMVDAKNKFNAGVKDFEANNNSVVIAAGNEGEFLPKLLQKHCGDFPLKTPKDFTTNIVENSDVTSVAATTQTPAGAVERNPESSLSDGVDIYASGDIDTTNDPSGQIHGTSFAAPRVAAAMAQIHKQFPSLSSAQVEELVRNSMSHIQENVDSSVPVLDQVA